MAVYGTSRTAQYVCTVCTFPPLSTDDEENCILGEVRFLMLCSQPAPWRKEADSNVHTYQKHFSKSPAEEPWCMHTVSRAGLWHRHKIAPRMYDATVPASKQARAGPNQAQRERSREKYAGRIVRSFVRCMNSTAQRTANGLISLEKSGRHRHNE